MKEALNYFYNINIENIKCINSYKLIATTNHVTYLLIESSSIDDIKYIFNPFVEEYYKRQNKYNIVININREYITKINEKYLILIKLPPTHLSDVNIENIIEFSKKNQLQLKNYKVVWDILWENKINYLNNYIINNESKYKNIMPYIYYYMGVSENCIIYLRELNKVIKHTINLIPTISHRRIFYPLKEIYLNNPFNFVVDVIERDIAEYIKSLYYEKKDYLNELEYYLKTNKLDTYEASLLYIRIVYPSYFFDFIENSDAYKNFDFYNTKKYEELIKKTYELINSYVNIQKIDWL